MEMQAFYDRLECLNRKLTETGDRRLKTGDWSQQGSNWFPESVSLPCHPAYPLSSYPFSVILRNEVTKDRFSPLSVILRNPDEDRDDRSSAKGGISPDTSGLVTQNAGNLVQCWGNISSQRPQRAHSTQRIIIDDNESGSGKDCIYCHEF